MSKNKSSTSYLDDARLAKRLAAGDESAFREFFEQNYDRLYRFALSRMPTDKSSAEDIVQQSLMNALDRIQSFRGEAQLFTWLCSICRNQITDWHRKNGKHRENVILVEDFPELQAIVDSLQAPSALEPGKTAEREESIRLIQVVLDRLPVDYGNVLEWRYVEGFSAKEIAKRFGISLEATNSLTARAKRAFAEIYKPLALTAHTPQAGGAR